MTLDLAAFRQSFIEEAREHVISIEQGLLALERDPQSAETVNAIFRAAHSIKGAAGTLGFAAIADYTHLLETILDAMRDGRVSVEPGVVSILLHATDDLHRLIDAGTNDSTIELDTTALRARLDSIATNPSLAQPQPNGPKQSATDLRRVRVTIAPNDGFFRTGLDPILIFRDLERLGALEGVACDLSKVPSITHLDPSHCYVAWTAILRTKADDAAIHDVFLFVADECNVTVNTDLTAPVERRRERRSVAPPAPNPAYAESSTLRVGSDKVDSIIDLVGELVIAQSMVMQLLDASALAKTPTLRDAISSMNRNMQDLQERVMGIRMVPVATLFGRFARIVRDTAAGLGKTVTLNVDGQDTEVDKVVIERLADPITHLVRNALDHGLETNEERHRTGKNEAAAIALSARHVAGGIVIEVSDNGRGLDVARIRDKADSIGLTNPSDVLSNEQIYALIFEPGFSTASAVSDLSGRGVGMDVVRRCVDSLNGTITVATERGQGTTIEIRLPLTLAILDGLLLRVDQQTYILPLLAVTESFRPKADAVRHVTGEGSVAIIRECALPLVDLGAEFGMCSRHRDPAQALVVVVEADGKRVGIVVDSLIGQSQVVVKSIETHYRRVDGVMGATILGDGKVAFIVDVAGLVRLAWARRITQQAHEAA